MAKDLWEKLEVISKIVVPLAVAASVYLYSDAANTRSSTAQMTQIAVGILQAERDEDETTGDALRTWAIEVLMNPGEIILLSASAAKELELGILPGASPAFQFMPWDSAFPPTFQQLNRY